MKKLNGFNNGRDTVDGVGGNPGVFDPTNVEIDYKSICKKYEVALIKVKSGDVYCQANGEESYINTSFCSGRDLYLGIYDNKDWETASFFHELGHIITTHRPDAYDCLIWHRELDAWMVGLQLAYEYGYYIKPSTFYDMVIENGLKTYDDWEEREVYNKSPEMLQLIEKYML